MPPLEPQWLRLVDFFFCGPIAMRLQDISATEVRCRECRFFDGATVQCIAGGRSPLRNCVIAVNQALLERLRPGDRILEVGCGSWSFIKSNLPPHVDWDGIDVVEVYEGRPTIATFIGSVSSIPFPEGSFDYVLANESIEHWYEYGVPIAQGMAEISRVLRPGGEAWLNFPIHLHGHRVFLAGDEAAIAARVVALGCWEIVRWEHWRRQPEPLERYAGWLENNDVAVENLIADPRRATSWIMNIVLRKVHTLRRSPLRRANSWLDALAFRIPPVRALALAANRGPKFVLRKVVRRMRLGVATRGEDTNRTE